ncbi:MAG: tetratricopeptide repeat protein [Saprospiraceae bacterium]|nr:tetratricopeptide repeat protein [Saprospiraceae bacterium]
MKKSMLLLAFLLPGIFNFAQTGAEALTQSDIRQHSAGAAPARDNEQLYQAYLAASQKKDKHEIQRVIDLFYDKIKSLETENRLEEIADVYEKIMEICQIEGYPTEKIPGCLYCQTRGLIKSGKYQRALAFQLKVVALEEKIYLPDHPNLAVSYYDLAQIYSHLGEHPKAVDLCVKATAIFEKNLSPDHLELAIGYGNLALAYSMLEDYAKALEFNLKTLDIHKKKLPSDDPELAISYNNVGISYTELGDHNKGLEFTLKALDILEKAPNVNLSDLANIYHDLALAYYYLENYPKALEFNQKALTFFEKTLPSDHISLANSYNNLALVYYGLGSNLKKGMEFNLKSISIYEKILPADDPVLAQAYQNVGSAYLEDGQLPKAKVYFDKYEKISKEEEQIYFNRALYSAALNDKRKALENLQKAVSLGIRRS